MATDSHSLAERDLVPGCYKVTGEALKLDEIINYVQSLQRQFEFLSLKLESVNSRLDFNMENLLSKDMFQQNTALPQQTYPLDSSAPAFYHHQNVQQQQLHSTNVSSGPLTQCSLDPLSPEIQMPSINRFTENLSQTYIKELELKDSPLEEENSKLKEAKANQFTTGSKKDGKKTETKIGLGLNLEDLEPHFGKRLEDVAEELDVGRSTIKRACRKYGINRWPCNKKNKSNPCNKKNRSNPTNGISCRDSQQNVPPSAASSKNVAMKVRFEDNTIKFDFCLSSGMEKLLSEVGRRLNLEVGGFKLKYLDEDGDDILLACDDDLQFYLKSLENVVEKTSIKLFVHL